MSALLDLITQWAGEPLFLFGFIFLLALANLFFPPLPLESVTLLAGYLAGTGRASLPIVILAATSGMFLGSVILYLLLRKHGRKALARTPLRRYFAADNYQRATDWFRRYGWWAIFFGKIIPGMSLYTVICSGLLHYPSAKALPAFFASNLFFFTALALLGQSFGHNWPRILYWLQHLKWLWILVIGAGIFIVFRARSRGRLP